MKKYLIAAIVIVSLGLTEAFSQQKAAEATPSVAPAPAPVALGTQAGVVQPAPAPKKKSEIGEEIAAAVNETLGSLDQDAIRVAESDTGKVAVFLVLWKVLTKDLGSFFDRLVGLVVGVPFLIGANVFFVWVWRYNTTPMRVPVARRDEGSPLQYEEKLPWFLKADASGADKVGFIICWWVMLAIANIWIVAGVIF